jgi:hypothetical protein
MDTLVNHPNSVTNDRKLYYYAGQWYDTAEDETFAFDLPSAKIPNAMDAWVRFSGLFSAAHPSMGTVYPNWITAGYFKVRWHIPDANGGAWSDTYGSTWDAKEILFKNRSNWVKFLANGSEFSGTFFNHPTTVWSAGDLSQLLTIGWDKRP